MLDGGVCQSVRPCLSSRSFSTTVFFSGVDRNHCQLFGVTAFFKRGYTVWEVRHVFCWWILERSYHIEMISKTFTRHTKLSSVYTIVAT